MLFEISSHIVYPKEEILLISPFKEIWDRDKSKNKTNALEEFAYMEFMSSSANSNPYRQYDPKVKELMIQKDIIKQNKWKPDKLVKKGIDKLQEFQENGSLSYRYYHSVMNAINSMISFFNNLDMSLTNDKGIPIYKPAEITRALNDVEKNLANLKALEKRLQEELLDSQKTRSNKKISPFADPNNLM